MTYKLPLVLTSGTAIIDKTGLSRNKRKYQSSFLLQLKQFGIHFLIDKFGSSLVCLGYSVPQVETRGNLWKSSQIVLFQILIRIINIIHPCGFIFEMRHNLLRNSSQAEFPYFRASLNKYPQESKN